jgi:uncharacterized membrane protein YfcA
VTIRGFALSAVENMSMRETVHNAIAWWRRQSAYAKKRLLIRMGAVAIGVVVGSIFVAKLTWGRRGPGLITPFAFAGLFLAAAILFVLTVVQSEELVDELESSRPPRVRRRGVYPRAMRRFARASRRSFVVWLSWVGATLRREVTRESIARWGHGLVDALRGVPPAGTPAPRAGPLVRPRPVHGGVTAEPNRRRARARPGRRAARPPRVGARRRDSKGSGLRA